MCLRTYLEFAYIFSKNKVHKFEEDVTIICKEEKEKQNNNNRGGAGRIGDRSKE
jgi:hypothetical protein